MCSRLVERSDRLEEDVFTGGLEEMDLKSNLIQQLRDSVAAGSHHHTPQFFTHTHSK